VLLREDGGAGPVAEETDDEAVDARIVEATCVGWKRTQSWSSRKRQRKDKVSLRKFSVSGGNENQRGYRYLVVGKSGGWSSLEHERVSASILMKD